jgi:hypothetical protein
MSLAYAWFGAAGAMLFTRLRNTGRLCREFVVFAMKAGSRSSKNPRSRSAPKNLSLPSFMPSSASSGAGV